VWFSRVPGQGRAALLVVLTALAYSPIFSAGFLNFDDPWLIEHNPYYAPDAWHTPWAAFFDLSRDTRLALGAEYLPLRDLLVWLQSRAFGLWAPGMHCVSVALYAAALTLMRGALRRTFGAGLAVELASLLFALHPLHVESVAWLAGQKDVLALLFVAWALYVHAQDGPPRRVAVTLLLVAACLSKSMSAAAIVLLVAQDLVKRRRLDALLYPACGAALAVLLGLHLYVGSLVGMVAAPAGGSRATALITMGPVWLRYLGLAFAPLHSSIAYDVPERARWDLPALAGYGVLFVWLLGALAYARSGRMRPLYTLLWFVGPLLPVSQVLAPLQNRMADRYLWLSVLVPCLVYAWSLEATVARAAPRVRAPLLYGLSGALLASSFVLTLARSTLFSDSLLLFSDGTRKTVHNTDAPLQLAEALEQRGQAGQACAAYRTVLARAPAGPVPDARRASNALARILAKEGRLDEAEQILRAARARFPHDPTVQGNLVKVLRGQGRLAEAEQLERALSSAAPRRGE
jgi:tetratricopeptide (TPR) repeat protein